MLLRTIISFPTQREQFITLFSIANFVTTFEAYYYVSPSQLKTKQVQFFQSFLKGHYCNSSLNTLSWSNSVGSRVTRTETLHYLRPQTEYCRATSLSHATILFINPSEILVFTELSRLLCVHFVIELLIYRTVAQPSVSHI